MSGRDASIMMIEDALAGKGEAHISAALGGCHFSAQCACAASIQVYGVVVRVRLFLVYG
jgi:hypothetical protein